MIETHILRILLKAAPNYHTITEGFAKQTFSVCTCRKCKWSSKSVRATKRECLVCKRITEKLDYDTEGYGAVARLGTCDAAQFIPEDYTNYKLESENEVAENEAVSGSGS